VPRINEEDMQLAISRLDTVRSKLIAGTLTFGEAVNKYSDEEQSKFTGGRKTGADGSPIISIDQMGKDEVVIIDKMKQGEYSAPFSFVDERGKKGVRILYLISRTEPHRENLKDDYSKIAERALAEKKEKFLEQWFRKHVKDFYLQVDQDYKSCEMLKVFFE
jgi:peptidyl-prolyl cis-trans isomerase SurA